MNLPNARRLLSMTASVLLALALTGQSTALVITPTLPAPIPSIPVPVPSAAASAVVPWIPDWSEVPVDQQHALLAVFGELAGDSSGALVDAWSSIYDALAPTFRAIQSDAEGKGRLEVALDDAYEAALPYSSAYLSGIKTPEADEGQNQTAMPGFVCTRDYHPPTQPQGFAWDLVCLVTQMAFLATLADYGCYWMDVLRERAGVGMECPREAVPNVGPLPVGPGGGPSRPNPPSSGGNPGTQQDSDGDGMGDEFVRTWAERTGRILRSPDDLDGDQLGNLGEFRWGLVPVCFPAFENCVDHERNPMSGVGGDGWLDGPEVRYWNDATNDAALAIHVQGVDGQAFQDPDSTLDTDGDGKPNVKDLDSDGDTIGDGSEFYTFGTYPELRDSDCMANQNECTLSSNSRLFDPNRKGTPGQGDGLEDAAERSRWTAYGPGAYLTNYDTDAISRNLLDPDADNDGLLDGQEFLLGKNQVHPNDPDSENDGLLDGNEVAWSEDTDLDGKVNANDPDSDGDRMPDWWEVKWSFNMVDPSDASTDRDGDLLSNLGEYQHGTNPMDQDSEGTDITHGDSLLDGEEVSARTDPLHWDTDRDSMADRFEVMHDLDPNNPADASLDADGDSFDLGSDGTIEKPWTNLDEYRSGRPVGYNEMTQGAWLHGTLPRDADTDKDTASDGFEAYYATNPNAPTEVQSDSDQDGLSWGQEFDAGADPNDEDTDGDGLCDGGRAPRCTFPGAGTTGFQPGEATYASNPWTTDSDADFIADGIEARFWDPQATGEDRDADSDFLGGINDADNDNDGLTDGQEAYTHLTARDDPDHDKDLLTDGEEVLRYSTNPRDEDTDGDRLLDGQEVQAHHTSPNDPDTDEDGLNDGVEVLDAGTDPLTSDTDGDLMADGWEYQWGTLPRVPDADQDPDVDSLSNLWEFYILTDPFLADTDGDTMSDSYEAAEGLAPRWGGDKLLDLDADGLSNFREFELGTRPAAADTDGDALNDGSEVNTYGTDPFNRDTDLDGIWDGPERAGWTNQGASWRTDYDGDALESNLHDPDSDNDGLRDGEEFLQTKTKPHDSDSDNDGLSDTDEVVTLGGRYDPNKRDTDGDGYDDLQESQIVQDVESDFDHDGMSNGMEEQHGTDSTRADSDCDGIEDGPELAYWGPYWAMEFNRLLSPDVDGDGIKDGVEIGAVGSPSEVLYLTNPASADTDGDGLRDNQEGRNSVRVSCNQPQATSLPSAEPLGIMGSSELAGQLVPGTLIEDASGLKWGADSEGIYIQGAYGIQLYVELPSLESALDPSQAIPALTAAGPSGKVTNPMWPDTDGDGLNDHEETYGTANSYKGQSSIPGQPGGSTNPVACDSDGDGLGDGLEVGRGAGGPYGVQLTTAPVCQRRDYDSGQTRSNPNLQDTDSDGLFDGPRNPECEAKDSKVEDRNCNGLADGIFSWAYCTIGAESDASDADSDDDGLGDATDLEKGCFDMDYDGLSDGLERQVRNPIAGTFTAKTVNVGGRLWPTWQPYKGEGLFTTPGDPDFDDDGLVDGLEDANHNGIFGDYSAEVGGQELHAQNADSDKDNIYDGKELLIYGAYNFPQVMHLWGGNFANVNFDSTNPFETNPRVESTDGNDGAPDGKDLLPRGDALLSFGFGFYRSVNRIDPNAGLCSDCGYKVDLLMTINVDTPAGPFAFNTAVINDWYTEREQNFNSLPSGALKLAGEQVKPTSVAGQLGVVGQNVKLDLPESTDVLTRRDPSLQVQLAARDDDTVPGGPPSFDVIDLSPEPGNKVFRQSLDLTSFIPNGGWTIDGANGGADGEGSDNGHLRVRIYSSLVPQFLRDAMRGGPIPPPQGQTCFGTAGCVV